MQAFDSIRVLRNRRKYDTSIYTVISESSTSDGSPAMIAPETIENEGLKIRTLTQEEVDEQIQLFITPVAMQLKDFIWLVPRDDNCFASEYLPKGR